MKPTIITNRNIMFSQPMGDKYDLNIGLILSENNNYIIDTGTGSGSVAPVLEYLANSAKPVIVINTHCHWDHIFGNHVFKNCPIIAHTTCRDMIPIGEKWDDAIKQLSDSIDGEVYRHPPNLTFESHLHFPEDGISIFHTPGHSADCISIYDSIDKVLYAGDNIGDTEDEIVPWIDTDLETFKRLIQTYKTYDFDICISGHNKPQPKSVISRMETELTNAWEKQNMED